MSVAGARVEQLWWATVAVLLLLTVATLAAQFVDRRLFDGASVWAKPTKFGVSLAVHFATLALAAGALGDATRSSALLWWVAVAAVASTAFEMAYIIFSAARQEASHFNVGTPVRSALYLGMAAGAVVITAAAAVVGALALGDGRAQLAPATRLGVGLGLIGGALLTLVIAFRMGGALTHHIGVEPAGAMRMPLTGWSLTVGDLRPPHFLATHMMQAVPLVGLLASRLPSAFGVAVVCLFAVGWVALTLAVFAQALGGKPVLTLG